MDRSPFERGDRVFDEPSLVQRVCVDVDLNVVLVRDGQRRVDRRRRRSPILSNHESFSASHRKPHGRQERERERESVCVREETTKQRKTPFSSSPLLETRRGNSPREV